MENLVSALTEGDKILIEELAAIGASEEDIAAQLRISLKHLRENYRNDLDYGSAKGRNEVLKAFYNQAHSGTNATSMSLWVKARCGWRDTGNAGVESPAFISVNIAPRKPSCPPSQ